VGVLLPQQHGDLLVEDVRRILDQIVKRRTVESHDQLVIAEIV